MFFSTRKFFFIFFTTTSFLFNIGCFANCACVSKHGVCHCPKDHCACTDESGTCPCSSHSGNSFETIEEIPYEAQNEMVYVSYEEDCFEENTTCLETKPLPQHQVYIESEFYQVHRQKAGGSKQNGWLYGGRIGYDRIKRCRIYWGLEGLYATGTLKGKNPARQKLKSKLTDENIEGRLGYTIQLKRTWFPTLVPFIGYGYFRETNDFKHPSPLPIKIRTKFDYFTVGFISQIYPHPLWVVGANFKARFLFNSKCKISDDPYFSDATQNFEHKVQYRAEVPITYRLNKWCDRLALSVIPFYEFRHYGEQANFPFDFKETKLNIYGFDLRLTYLF